MFQVINHQYGATGAEPKNLDTKSLILDFEFLQEISNLNFISKVKESINQFVQALKESHLHTGKIIFIKLSIMASCTYFFYLLCTQHF